MLDRIAITESLVHLTVVPQSPQHSWWEAWYWLKYIPHTVGDFSQKFSAIRYSTLNRWCDQHMQWKDCQICVHIDVTIYHYSCLSSSLHSNNISEIRGPLLLNCSALKSLWVKSRVSGGRTLKMNNLWSTYKSSHFIQTCMKSGWNSLNWNDWYHPSLEKIKLRCC